MCCLRRCTKPDTSFLPTTFVGVNSKTVEPTLVKVKGKSKKVKRASKVRLKRINLRYLRRIKR